MDKWGALVGFPATPSSTFYHVGISSRKPLFQEDVKETIRIEDALFVGIRQVWCGWDCWAVIGGTLMSWRQGTTALHEFVNHLDREATVRMVDPQIWLA